MAYKPTNPNGQETMANSEPVVIASDQSAVPVSGTVAVTNAGLTALNGAISGTEVQVDVLTMPTTTVTATDLDIRNLVFATDKVDASGTTLGANSGVDIGDVTINNSSGASAVNIQDGGNTITVDNGGTFAVQSTLQAGTNYAGKVRLTDGTTDAEVVPLTNYNAQAVAIVDGSGNQITSFGSPSAPLFSGKTASFRTLGRAGTAGQKIAAIHNATGSSIKVKIRRIRVNMWVTVVKAVTIAPPIIRIWKFTAVPTNGTVLTKNKTGGSTTSDASCTLWGDASVDGTGSATTLTVTLPAGTILDQRVTQRIITAVGEVGVFEAEFDYPEYIELAALEGVCVFLDYTLATQNPTTDMWLTSIQWEETS
jgi:hypothetical protein